MRDHLVPVKVTDKNGRLVTRYVRPGTANKLAAALPAPALALPAGRYRTEELIESILAEIESHRINIIQLHPVPVRAVPQPHLGVELLDVVQCRIPDRARVAAVDRTDGVHGAHATIIQRADVTCQYT